MELRWALQYNPKFAFRITCFSHAVKRGRGLLWRVNMKSFWQGTCYLLLGVRHLFTKGLRRFIILPLLLNFLMFAGLFYLNYHYLLPYAYRYLNQLPSWLSFLSTLFFIIFV